MKDEMADKKMPLDFLKNLGEGIEIYNSGNAFRVTIDDLRFKSCKEANYFLLRIINDLKSMGNIEIINLDYKISPFRSISLFDDDACSLFGSMIIYCNFSQDESSFFEEP